MGADISSCCKNILSKYRFTSNDASRDAVNHALLSPFDLDTALVEVGLRNIVLGASDECVEVAQYCLLLFGVQFYGQTGESDGKNTDKVQTTDVLNLGLCLSLLDRFLKQFEKAASFTGEEEEYNLLLKLIARKRCNFEEGETEEQCWKRLNSDTKRFVQIYHKRNEKSYNLEHGEYWGTRQQLLSAKVIADWVDRINGPLDPIFGVLLQPTAGRVGPGDSGFLHNMLFEGDQFMAYHSAVHDAFGYLMTSHGVGPGYDYLHESTFFAADHPLAGQTPGISFWRRIMKQIDSEHRVLKYWKC